MRVLQVLPSIGSESGGPVRSTLANCRALHAADPSIETTLATTDQGLSITWQANIRALLPARMDLKIFPAIGQAAFTFSPQLLAWVRTNCPKYDLVVIRALLHPISTSTAWMASRHSVPYIIVPHGTLSNYTFKHRRTLMKRAYFRVVEERTLRRASAVQFTCKAEHKEAPKWNSRCLRAVIPHAYEVPSIDVGKVDLLEHQVLFLSRLHHMKGLDVLLPAFAQLLHAVPDATLVLAGSGVRSYESHLRQEIRRLGLNECVLLPGFVEGEAKAILLAQSAVFALPSFRENFGIAVVEAMAAGLPVVISRGVGIWSEVQNCSAGLVVHQRSVESVRSAIEELLLDSDRRHQMGINAQRLVKELYHPGVVGPRLLELYHAVAGNPPVTREAEPLVDARIGAK